MPTPDDAQAAFARAVLDVDQPVPEGVRSHLRTRPLKRFGVYRNNILMSLTGVLQGRFPVVSRLLGDEFFCAAARAYVSLSPPVSPVLMRYGATFADFLDNFEPVDDLPYLGDVARLEWAWSQAYHAADQRPLGVEAFQQVPPGRAENLIVAFHPSVHLVRSRFPVVTIVSAHSGDEEPEDIDAGSGGEDALVVRPRLSVEIRRLPAGGAAFIADLAGGRTLGQAALAASRETAAFDFEANLAGLITSGGLVTFQYSSEGSSDPGNRRGEAK